MKIARTEIAGFQAYRLSTSAWETICIPELGANLPEFVDLATGRQWLYVNPEVPIQRHDYGCPYGWGSADGIDECFPAIAQGRYPNGPHASVVIPDHGDLWTLPWVVEEANDVLRTHIHGPLLPYRFERTLSETEDGQGMLFSYRLTNTGTTDLDYMWSSHPVFAAVKGMGVDVEPGAEFSVYAEHGGRFGGVGTTHRWGEGSAAGAGVIPPCRPSAMLSHKLFIQGLARNWVALYDSESDSHLRVDFDSSQIDTVGLWMQMCGPAGTDQIALEPCMGNRDGLDECLEAGTARTLAPGKMQRWWWSLTPVPGRPTA